MKRVLLFLIFCFFIFSGTVAQDVPDTTVLPEYFNNPFVKKYRHFKGIISPDSAKIFIRNFPRHTYRGLRKKRLNNAWSEFDNSLTKQLANDSEVDKIVYLLASFPKKKSYKKLKGHPFVLMKVITKEISMSAPPTALSSHLTIKKALQVYFIPGKICPPPDAGCVVPGM